MLLPDFPSGERCPVRPDGPTLPLANAPVPTIAITGGVGCGKSTLGRLLAERGAEVVDADDLVHRLQQPGGALSAAVARTFGPEFLTSDGSVDRAKLGALVFADPVRLAALNAVTHPPVRSWFASWRKAPASGWAKAALIPLLFESGWSDDWDFTVCVVCDPGIQRSRLRARGWDDGEIERRMAAQWPSERKAAQADFVVRNDAGLDALQRAADTLRQAVLEKHHV